MPLEFLKLTDTFLAEKGKKTLKPMKGSPLHCRAYKGVAITSLFISDQTCPPGVLFPFNMGGLGYLPGGYLPPPKFGHLPPPKSDISHPQKKHLPGGQLPPPIFFLFFWRTFLGFFHLKLMEDIKGGMEEVLDEVVMEHIK